MPSDSVASFLDRARRSRLLLPDEVEDLTRRPEAPRQNLDALYDFLQARGTLTRYQADCLRAGRGDDLTFAGYALTDDLGPCPGGTAFRTLHPSLRTPLVLRRFRADWLAPGEDPAAVARRAKDDVAPLTHLHLAHLLDAGVEHGELYAVLEPFDGADLETLVRDIGPVPTALACEFARQAAAGLQAAHARGLSHGDVRPANLSVGPLVESSRTRPDGSPRRRPAAGAAVKVFGLGLVPRRPAADLPPDVVAFLPPERLETPDPTPAGDVYGLGASLFFLLTGRPPFLPGVAGGPAAAVRSGDPPPLKDLRPDVPDELAGLVRDMLSKDPAARPAPAAVVADRLAPLARPGPPAPAADVPLLTPAAEPEPVPLTPAGPGPEPPDSVNWVVTPYTGPDQSGAPVYAVEASPADPFASSDGEKSPFAPSTTETPVPRAVRAADPDARERARKWVLVGGLLWILTIPLWLILLSQQGCFDDKPDSPQHSSGPKQYRR